MIYREIKFDITYERPVYRDIEYLPDGTIYMAPPFPNEKYIVKFSIGREKHKLIFWPANRIGDFLQHHAEFEGSKMMRELLCSENKLLHNPRLLAVEAYIRSQFGESYSADFTEIIDKKTGERLGHWAARKDILPDDFRQWNLTDKNGKTVLEVALHHRGLTGTFKDFDMEFIADGKKTTVADYVKEHGVRAYQDTVAKYEAQRKAESKERKSVRS